MRMRIKRNSLGVVLIALLTMIIIGVITIAPTCSNEFQLIGRLLLAAAIVVTFAFIRKQVKKVRNNKFK